MKSFIIVAGLLLIPTVAFAYPFQWENTYEGVAGGALKDQETVKARAIQNAHDAAKVGGCEQPFRMHKDDPRGQIIGQIEPPVTCQCVDDVCICSDTLKLVCLIKGDK